MKILSLLEKNKSFWAVFILSFLFFLLRLPSLIEPNWYGDEGIYEVIGQALRANHLLYRDIWDNKPPLLYLIYAATNGDQMMVRTLSMLAGILSLVILYFLSRKLFVSRKISICISFLYTILFATPLMEGNIANAENFILLPVIAAGYLVYINSSSKDSHKIFLFVAGMLLGIGFLLKIVATFDFMAFFMFLLLINLPKINKNEIYKKITQVTPLTIGFILPILITFISFFSLGIIKEFVQAAFFGNINYVGWQNTFLGIPQGLLIVKVLGVLIAISIIFLKRKAMSKPVLFILVWLIFAIFSTYFSGRPYTHYVLVLLPTYCLFFGLALSKINDIKKNIYFPVFIVISIIVFSYFHLYGLQKTYHYYQNTIQFITNNKSLPDFQAFFDKKVPRDYAVANFIITHTKSQDSVFIWGNNAQIYALAHKLPLTKYTVAYHVLGNKIALADTQNALNTDKPKYIITLHENEPLPFYVQLYIMRFRIEGATIYERNF